MARFNFTEIDLTSAADITEIMNNFRKIESLGITSQEVSSAINAAKSDLQSAMNTISDNLNNNYTKTANLSAIAKTKYSYGTAAPSGGSNGDVYDQYFN